MKNKPIRKALSLLFALVMVVSCFASTASAAESTSLLGALSDSFSKALVTATANPTPETPLTYSYTVKLRAHDLYGRIPQDIPETYVSFYLSEDDYKKGAKPIDVERVNFYRVDHGEGTAIYEAVFVQKPPTSLYYVVDAQPDMIYTPMKGTVYAEYAG